MAAFGAITKAAQEDVSSKPEKTVLVPKSVGVEVSCFCTRFIIHRRKLVKSLLTIISGPAFEFSDLTKKRPLQQGHQHGALGLEVQCDGPFGSDHVHTML